MISNRLCMFCYRYLFPYLILRKISLNYLKKFLYFFRFLASIYNRRSAEPKVSWYENIINGLTTVFSFIKALIFQSERNTPIHQGLARGV